MTMTTTMTMKNDKLKRRRKKMIINYHVGGGGDGGRNQFLFFHQVEKNGHRFNIMVFFFISPNGISGTNTSFAIVILS